MRVKGQILGRRVCLRLLSPLILSEDLSEAGHKEHLRQRRCNHHRAIRYATIHHSEPPLTGEPRRCSYRTPLVRRLLIALVRNRAARGRPSATEPPRPYSPALSAECWRPPPQT